MARHLAAVTRFAPFPIAERNSQVLKRESARSPHDSGRFILVAGEGFEPPTSGL